MTRDVKRKNTRLALMLGGLVLAIFLFSVYQQFS